jgi:DNA-directed RNA polymerase specialized sigma24 family protein
MPPNQPIGVMNAPGALVCNQEGLFLKMHTELSIIGYFQLKNWLVAQDIATDCLLAWYLGRDTNGGEQLSKRGVMQMLRQACVAQLKTCQQRQHAEQQFIKKRQTETFPPASQYEEQKNDVLAYLPHLPTLEAAVIRLQLEQERDLPEIATILNKPLQTIRLLQDRAIYLLRKKFQPGTWLLHQYP